MANNKVTGMQGVDVAKDWVDVSDGKKVTRVTNNRRMIKAFIKGFSAETCIAVESTSSYHEVFVEQALLAGHKVYLVDAYRLSRYRDAVGVRAKTDLNDAHLLFRYLTAEIAQLTLYQPVPKTIKRLNTLLRVRSKLAKSKATIGQSLKNIGELAIMRTALMARIKQSMLLIDKRIKECIEQAGYLDDYKRCQTIPGVGPVNAAALVAVYHRGTFCKADSFIAFMGLDVRVRESGRYRGKRKLTKRGNPEIRRLLFNAARAASRTSQWNTYYLSLRDRGLSTTASGVVISRKIARLAFALLRDQSEYRIE